MSKFGRDPRIDILKMPLDLDSVLTYPRVTHDPELCLERGSIEITRRENAGQLPELPQTDEQYAQCSLASNNYAKNFTTEHERSIPSDFRLQTLGFCYPEGRPEFGRTLQFLVKSYSATARSWYGSSTGLGVFRYSWGPVATQVSCPATKISGFWDTPLFSLGAYQEDVERIKKFNIDLARGKGERSFLFAGVMHALANRLESETIEPKRICLVKVDRSGPALASIRVNVLPYGSFIADTEICRTTWRVLIRRPRKE